MATRFVARAVLLLALGVSIAACRLPGAASPTPFIFPTPNLTHTAIFAALATETPSEATHPPPETPPPPIATIPPVVTVLPSPTLAPLSFRPNGSPVSADYLATAPTIDGVLSEWTTTAYTADQVVFGAAAWTGTSDLSATYYIGWDSGNLYLAARVTDDRHAQVSSGRYLYKGDDIEIQLDTDLPGDYYSTTLSADDYQIGLSPGDFAARPAEAFRWYPAALEASLPAVAIAARKTDQGYDLEARIPWSVFGVTPAGRATYGFALSFSDNDQAGSAVQQSMVSSVGTRRLQNPTTWGTLILAPVGGS